MSGYNLGSYGGSGSGSYGGSSGGGSNTYSEARYVGQSGTGNGNPLSQLCGSCCVSIFGIILYFVSLYLIASNEHSSVCIGRALDSAFAEAEEVKCDGRGLEGAKGSLIYAACKISDDSLRQFSPSDFGAQLDGAFNVKALKVAQEVSMFQCTEKKHKRTEGEGQNKREIVSWTYSMDWASTPINSRNFAAFNNGGARQALHSGCGNNFRGNPGTMPLESKTLSSEALIVGVFDVARHLKKIDTNREVQITKNKALRLPGGSDQQMQPAQVQGGSLYSCSPGSPDVGCLRVRYRQSSATSASIVTRLGLGDAGIFKTKAWPAPSSWMCSSGGASNAVDLFREGSHEVTEVLASEQDANTTSTYIYRALGVFLVCLGVMLFLQPIQTIANLIDQFLDWFKFIPILGSALDFFGNVVAGAVSCAIFMIALGIGLPSALTVFALAWCVMRPLLGIPLLCACVAVFGLTVKKMMAYAEVGKEKRAKVKPQ